MRKLGRYALRAAVGAFVLGSLALFAANLYVQSRGVQQRIRTTLSAILRTPVSLRKTTVTPWDGIRLDGVTLHDEDAARPDGSTDFLTAASFRVRLAWWPLLTRRQLVVLQVLLDRPQLTLRESPEWLPVHETARDEPPGSLPTAEQGEPMPSAAAGALSPTAPTDVSPAGTTATMLPLPSQAKILLFPTKKLRLRHGGITARDREDHARFRVEEINADGSVADPEHAQGALWFAKASTGEVPGATLTNYWTAVDYDAGTGLVARDGRGNIAGGVLTTMARLQPQADRWFLTTTDKLENVALGQLTRPTADGVPLAEGQLHADLDLRGFIDDSASIAGGGRLWLTGARVQNIPLLAIVGQVLRISDLSQLTFKQAQMDYRVEDNVVHLSDLTLVSNDSQMVLRGEYLLAEDRLDLHGRLTIDRAISRQLPQFIESNFTRCGSEAPGSRYLDFDLVGPLDDPKCNLYDRLTAGPMKGLLDNLLAPKSKNPKNQRPDGDRKARPGLDAPSPKP